MRFGLELRHPEIALDQRELQVEEISSHLKPRSRGKRQVGGHELNPRRLRQAVGPPKKDPSGLGMIIVDHILLHRPHQLDREGDCFPIRGLPLWVKASFSRAFMVGVSIEGSLTPT